jgi:hypothetical protein
MILVALLLALLGAAEGPRYAAFGRFRTWTLVNLVDGKPEWLPLPPSLIPRELTVSVDGRTVVFTGYSETAGTNLLYAWDKDPAHPPRSIGDTRGYHANPAVDAAGEWVYFAHNPDAVGLPMSHTSRAYAQIYRVHLDGSGLQRLTDEQGCHFAPSPGRGGKLLFVHTQCHGHERALVRMTLANASEATLKMVGDANETMASDDGRKLLYVVSNSGFGSVFELDVGTGASMLIDQGRIGSRAEPRFGAGRQIYYALNDAVWSMKAGRKQRIVSLQEGPR